MTEPARLTVVHPYWTFWQHTTPPGFRAERLRQVRETLHALNLQADIDIVEVSSEEDGRAAGAQLTSMGPDAVLIVQTMAVPPTYALGVLDAMVGLPVVIWALQFSPRVPGDFDHGDITTMGATVGAPMLTNALTRFGRRFAVEMGHADDAASLRRAQRAVRAALAVGRIRRSRLGRIGRPLDGYVHVDVDDEALHDAMGISVVNLEPQEVLDRYRAVSGDRVKSLEDDVRRTWNVAPDAVGGEALERSLRVALAVEDLVADHALDAGAMNCHVPEIRFGEMIGVTPCFGLGRLTSQGIPWTCTGDATTAVAMLTAKALGGAALYHEIEAVDQETDEVVLANSGEHDTGWLAPGERPRLVRNDWFCGVDPRCGVCAAFELAAGPATLVGFTPHPDAPGGFRYVTATGELTSRSFPQTGTPNGSFRFASGPAFEAWSRWVRAGVNHHSAASQGDISAELAAVAHHLGIDCVAV